MNVLRRPPCAIPLPAPVSPSAAEAGIARRILRATLFIELAYRLHLHVTALMVQRLQNTHLHGLDVFVTLKDKQYRWV